MNYCGTDGTKLVDGQCPTCATAKSTSSVSVESLEKSLDALEALSKGVRPEKAKGGDMGKKSAKDYNAAAVLEQEGYGDHGEGDSEEEPKTKKNVEAVAKKGGFVPPGAEDDDDEDEKEREREMMEREEGQPEGDEEPEFKSAKGKKKAKKSFADEVMEDETMRKAIDVSPFLNRFVTAFASSQDEVIESVSKSFRFASYQRDFNVGLATALVEMGNIVKSLTEKVESLGKSPAATRKADSSAAVIEKSFPGGTTNGDNKLTKSQMASKLLNMLEAGDKSITESDILRAESDGFVRPALAEKLGLNQQ